ncbi:MAG: hypothetical protein HC930_08530 [Hydrococcus sp. SU_1_0]|nr:hypothetical protein [Hydrococcus sp. SU_1_0]
MNLTTVLLNRDSLASKVVAELIGDRSVNLAEEYGGGDNNGGGLIAQIFNLGARFAGFLISAVLTGIGWTLSSLWDVAIEAYFEIKYFDWAQSDADIKSDLAANDALIAGAFGRLAGTGLVWLTGIGVAVGLSFKFPVVASRVALAIAEEGGQEIRSALTNLIIASRQAAIRSMLLGGLLTARKLELFGLKPVINSQKPWTFADEIEKKIEALPSAGLRAFVSQFGDAVEDSIIEMGYVISFTLDDYYASQRFTEQAMLGTERTIELTPNVAVPDERIILEAPQELIISDTQNVIAHHQLIDNRDVGQIVGMPEQDYLSPRPQRRKLKVIFRGKEQPPWKLPDGKYAMTAEVNIPDLKPGTTWQQLKANITQYTWGKYRVTAHLSNGRQMRVHAVSYSEGEQQLNKYINLSTAEIIRFNHGVTATDNPLDPSKSIVPQVVYPAYAKLVIGDVRLDGTLQSKSTQTTRVNLWTDTEPEPPISLA